MDARGHIVGRLATRIALILQGKHKPIFTPANDCGDYVVVTNTRHLKFTGDKLRQKGYYSHTGYPGGLKRIPARVMMEREPETVLLRAVKGMLPKNKLQNDRLARLRVFAAEAHPYTQNIAKSYESIPQEISRLGTL